MIWRFRSSEPRSRAEPGATFRPNPRFLRPLSGRTGRRSSLRRLGAALGRRWWAAVAAIALVGPPVMLWAHFGGSEVRRFHRLPYFHISRLVVEGNQRIPRQVIIDRLRLPPQASVLDVDLHDLAARLMVDPWIQRAAVSRRLPSGLTVRVWERRPVAVVVSDRPYLVSDDALVLTETTLQEAVGLPVVRLGVRRPPTVGEEIDASRLARCTRVWRRVGEEAPGLATVLREVRLEGDGSFTILLTGGMPYLRVREEGLSESLERLREVVGIRGRHLRELEYVDLRFGDRVIVRPVGKGGEA